MRTTKTRAALAALAVVGIATPAFAATPAKPAAAMSGKPTKHKTVKHAAPKPAERKTK